MNRKILFKTFTLLAGMVVLFLFSTLGLTAEEDDMWFELKEMIDDKGEVWGVTAEDFMSQYAKRGFVWVSASNKNQARAYKCPLKFMGRPAVEAIARFEDGKLDEISISVFNRGDLGDRTEQEFEKMVRDTRESIDEWMKERAVPGPQAMKTAGMKQESLVWTKDPNQVKIEWSYTLPSKASQTPFIAEYITFSAHSSSGSDYSSRSADVRDRKGAISVSAMKANITKDDDGSVYLSSVPMVDQGEKGYCAVATAERILRYYGRDVDQHELAQMASTTEMGTSPELMMEALRRMGGAYGCKTSIHEKLTSDDFVKMVNKYNREAKKADARIVDLNRIADMGQAYMLMDKEVFKTMKLKESAYKSKFERNVKSYIDKGIPIAWSVMLGIVPEPEIPQAFGGHMRLIIGYNNKEKEIIYSDSWGAGHGLKKMATDDAWTITTGLYTVEPRTTKL